MTSLRRRSKLFIPPLGSYIRLTKKWKFDLFNEKKNEALLRAFGHNCSTFFDIQTECMDGYPITLEKGTILRLDTLHVLAGKKRFTSTVSFRVEHTEVPFPAQAVLVIDRGWRGLPNLVKKLKKPQFWARLDDVNNSHGEILDSFNAI